MKTAACPKIIWTLWLQGWEQAPPIVQACITSWRRLNPAWRINALDENSLRNFLPAETLADVFQTPSDAIEALTDRIRIELLARYGGVWVDGATMCARPLDDWLHDHLTEDFFAFERPAPDRMIASWFLAAKRGSYIIDQWRQRTSAYWFGRKQRGDYFWFHQLFAQGASSDPEWWRLWEAVPKLPAMHLFHFGPTDERLMGQAALQYAEALAASPPNVFKLSHKQSRPIEPGSTVELLARFGAGELLSSPLPSGAAVVSKRILVCWYGSFAGHGTIGDLRSLEAAVAHLVGRGHVISHATAAPLNLPGARCVQWHEVASAEFDAVVFVCGPILRSHPQTSALFSHLADRPLVGVGVSLLARDNPEHHNPFQVVFARQGGERAFGDIAITAPPTSNRPRVKNTLRVGVSLRGNQSEYGAEACLWQETESLARAAAEAALSVYGGHVVDVENHLARSEVSADAIDAVYAGCDLVITSRFHGAAMALRYGVPFIAIDQIAGGAKVFDLLAPLGWPHVYRADQINDEQIRGLAMELVMQPDQDLLLQARARAVIEASETLAALDDAIVALS